VEPIKGGARRREHAGGQLQVGQRGRVVGEEGRERGGELIFLLLADPLQAET
jgi:hypothetical protein